MRTVWFHRDYAVFTGGHLKHSHYVGHVACMANFVPRIAFGCEPANDGLAEERRQLWPSETVESVSDWAPHRGDILFVAGKDWRYLLAGGFDQLPIPIINFVQGIRHAKAGTELYGYLARKAIRICVSQEVADAINATGRTHGPVLVIPNGIDIDPVSTSAGSLAIRKTQVLVSGYKRPDLAQPLSQLLAGAGIQCVNLTRLRCRHEFLEQLAESHVVVCLPLAEEGFYLPALESMAKGCLVVTLDCVGNRGFCRNEENCLIAEPTAESLFAATKRVLNFSVERKERIVSEALATARLHSLAVERTMFQALLADIERIWESP